MGINHSITPYQIFVYTGEDMTHIFADTIMAEHCRGAVDQWRASRDADASLIVIGEALHAPQRRIAAIFRAEDG